MAQNNIKTILSVDDKDVKSKLEGLKKYYSDTFKSWTSATAETKHATQELSLAQTRLTKARYEVAAATAESGRVSKEELKALNAEVAASRNAVSAAKQRVSASKEAAAAMWQEMEASKKAQAVLGEGTKKVDEHSRSLEQNWNQLIRVARWAGTLIGVYYGLSRAWEVTIGKGVEVGRQIEDMGNGIAALTAAGTLNVTTQGRQVNALEKFRIATAMTSETMAQLRKVAVETPGTFGQLSAIFQQAYVSTIKMGQGFGLTVDEITKNTVQLSGRMANIAGAIGMPMEKALEETRSLMSGQASGDSLIASLLFGSPTRANEAMRNAKEAGALGVKKMLDEVMGAFDVLAGVDSYTKSMANAQGAYENLMVALAKPVKDIKQDFFNQVTATLTPENIKAITDAVGTLGNTLSTVIGLLDEVMIAFVAWKTIPPILKATQVAMVEVTLAVQAYQVAGAAAAASTVRFSAAGTAVTTALSGVLSKLRLVAVAFTSVAVPLGVVIGAYELYNDLIVKSNKIEEESNRILRTKIANIRDMATETIRANRATLDAAIQAKSLEYAQARSRLGGSPTDPEARSSKEQIRAEYQNLLDMRKEYNSVLQERITKEKEALKVKGQVDSLRNSGVDMGAYSEHKQYVEQHLPKEIELKKQIAVAEANIARAKKEGNSPIQQKIIEDETAFIIAARKELGSLKDKASAKAEVEANKENRRQLSAMEKMQQLHQTEMAYAQMVEASKVANFGLDKSRLSELEQLKLRQLDNEGEGLANELIATSAIEDVTLRNFEQNQALEKIYKNRAEYATLFLKLEQGITQELEQQNKEADKVSRMRFSEGLSQMLRSTKTPEEQTRFERLYGKGKIGRAEAYGLIDQAKAKYRSETFSITEPKEREKARQDLNKFVDDVTSKIVEIPDIEIKFKIFGGDELTRSLAGIADISQTVNDQTEYYNGLIQEAKLAGKDTKLLEEAKAQSQIAGYGQIANAMSSMFAQGSREAVAFRTIESGLAVVAGVRAILTQGSGDPYTAFARIAAMTALVASTLQSAGIAFGGAGSVSTSYDAFAAQAVNTGTGTVLGDTSAQSESIKNSLSILEDLAKPEFRLMTQMNESLLSIDQKIGGLSANILRAAGFATGEGYVPSSGAGGVTSFMNSGVGGLLTGGASTALMGMGAGAAMGLGSWAAMGSFGPIGLAVGAIDQLLLGGTFSNLIGGAINSIIGGIFGGDSETTLHDAGIAFTDQFIEAAMTGLEGQSYQVARTVTDGGWFSGDSESYNSYFSQLDDYTRRQFQLVIGNLYDTTVMAGGALGASAGSIEAELSDFVVSLGKISLKDKTGEQIQKDLTSIFGTLGDQLVKEAFKTTEQFMYSVERPIQQVNELYYAYLSRLGAWTTAYQKAEAEFEANRGTTLDAFQQIGEGLFETMSRVSGGMQEAGYYIDRLGNQFTDVVYTDILNKQGNVAIEALRQSIMEEESNLIRVGTRTIFGHRVGIYEEQLNNIGELIKTFNGNVDDLYTFYITLGELQNAFEVIGTSTTSLTSSMLYGAGGVDALSDATQNYMDIFFTEGEKLNYLTRGLRDSFSSLGLELPVTKQGFTDLLHSIDLSTESGQELYGRVILLADGFGEFSDQLSGIYEPVRNLSDAFSGLSQSLGDTINTLLSAQTGTGTTNTRSLIGRFWSARGEIDSLLAKKGDLTTGEQERLQGLIGTVSSLSTSIQSSVVGANTAMTSSLVTELGNVQEVLDLQNTVLKTVILNSDGSETDIATEGTLTQLVAALGAAGLSIPTGVLPSFDVGSPYLPSDMVAQVHRGEMIIDAQSSNVLRKYGISSNDYLTPVMNRIYDKLDEMAGYMRRLDYNIDTAMQGRALRTVV